ncbi:hypothetical protein GJ496_007902 [Pomphorhynchus laevis]|nr:hypothetical protein GJ496_007902 [Pomphorhynchus laevis]
MFYLLVAFQYVLTIPCKPFDHANVVFLKDNAYLPDSNDPTETVELQDNDVFTPSSVSEDPDPSINNSDVQVVKIENKQCRSYPTRERHKPKYLENYDFPFGQKKMSNALNDQTSAIVDKSDYVQNEIACDGLNCDI